MKNWNKKQIAYSKRKVSLAKYWAMYRMFYFTMLILAIPAITFAVVEPNAFSVVTGLAFGGGVQLMTMAAIGNIADDSDQNSVANQIAYDIRLIETSQIDTAYPFPQPNASREVADITLLTGEVNHEFISHSRPTYSGTGELNDYTVDPNKEIQIVLANAFRDKVLDFVEQMVGGKFILLFRRIETTQWYMIGSLDQPLRFNNYEVKGDGEASVAICKFGNKAVRQYYKYVGTVSAVAAETIAADATALAVTDNDKYQLTDGSASAATIATVSGIAAADHGRTITIYGSGGSYPSVIADNSVFTLAEGASWTGNAGSKISFRILDNSTLIEVLGSRVQTS